MNCLFCPDVPVGVFTRKKSYHICTHCSTRYRFEHGKLQAYAIDTFHKGRWYVGEFKVTEPVQFTLTIEDEGSDSQLNAWFGTEIMHLDHLPNIDRSNFKDKIPTLLVFS